MTAGANSTTTTSNDLPSFDLQLRPRPSKNHHDEDTLDLNGPELDFHDHLDRHQGGRGKDGYDRRREQAGNEDEEDDDDPDEDDEEEAIEPTSPVLVKGRSGTALIEDTF